MKRPKKKTNFAVSGIYPFTRMISITTTAELVAQLSEFGVLRNNATYGYPDNWWLDVDERYDFNEVAAFVKQIEQNERTWTC